MSEMPTIPQYGTTMSYVYSPDDGGWYAEQTDLDNEKTRVTKKIYPTEEALRAALLSNRKVWEKWT